MSFPDQLDEASGSGFAWSTIWNENEQWITEVLRNRLQSADEVEDVAQEVKLGLMKSKTRPADLENPSAWIYRVAIRQVLMYRRKKGRYQKLLKRERFSKSPTSIESPSPLSLLLRTERIGKIREMLTELNETDREVLMLKYSDNWTYKQLADKLGVSVNTIEHRLVKAKKRLRKLMVNADGEVKI